MDQIGQGMIKLWTKTCGGPSRVAPHDFASSNYAPIACMDVTRNAAQWML